MYTTNYAIIQVKIKFIVYRFSELQYQENVNFAINFSCL